jgi:hypothetical protein
MYLLKNILTATLLMVMLSANSSYAQYVSKDYPDSTKSKNCLKTSDFLIEGYYGYPYLVGAILKANLDSTNTIKNFNLVGVRMEYLILKNFGVGLEYTYALVDFKYEHNSAIYTGSISKQRFLGKAYFHILEDDAKTDAYITAGLGSTLSKIKSTEPKNNIDQNITLIPVSFRLGVGFRHFFNDYFGFNGEIGIGGPLIQAGLTFKM